MIGQLIDETESVAIDQSGVASLGATTLSMVFDARRRAEESKRAQKEIPGAQQSTDLGPAASDWHDISVPQVESRMEPGPGRQASLRRIQNAGSGAPLGSSSALAPGSGVASGTGGRQSPLVRALLRVKRPAPQSAVAVARNFVPQQEDRIEPATLISHTVPVYPAIAKQSLIAGSVEVHFRISAEGKVYDVRSVGGSPVLAQAAIEAVEAWCFEPARLNGRPIDSQSSTDFDFRLN